MTIWEFGLETAPFDAVVSGKKTIEGRLNTGKFAEFAAGDTVKVRKDHRDEHGVRHDGEPDAARVRVVAVRHYPDFAAMVRAEGHARVSSAPISEQQTIDSYGKYYSAEDQARHGVLAIEIAVIGSDKV